MPSSVIAMPMGMSGVKTITVSPSASGVIKMLDDAEHLFWSDLGLVTRTGKAQRVRDAAVTLARIRALQNSLGRVGKNSSVVAATLLGLWYYHHED
jgi:separase